MKRRLQRLLDCTNGCPTGLTAATTDDGTLRLWCPDCKQPHSRGRTA